MAMITIGSTAVIDPSKMTVSIMDISNAERNANGLMTIDRVATKRKISLEWPAMNVSNMSAILNAVSPIFFSVTYMDALTGANATKTFYVGDRTSPVLSMMSGVMMWDGLKLDLVEQ
jgi:hypothetical protein